MNERTNDNGYTSFQDFLDRENAPKTKVGRKESRYAIMEPDNYLIVRYFDNLRQLENFIELSKLSGRLYLYENYKINETSSPTIKGYIIIKWKDNDVAGMDNNAIIEFLYNKVRGYMVISELNKIKPMLKDVDENTINEIFKSLNMIRIKTPKMIKWQKNSEV